jgi:alpha-L-rhamnosidase
MYGNIKSSWKQQNDIFILDIEIPANTTADVYLPTGIKEKITESGKQIYDVKEIQFVKVDNGKTLIRIGSGKYKFEVK